MSDDQVGIDDLMRVEHLPTIEKPIADRDLVVSKDVDSLHYKVNSDGLFFMISWPSSQPANQPAHWPASLPTS